jgi:hypothetical protein
VRVDALNFEDREELADLLRDLSMRAFNTDGFVHGDSFPVLDVNGNTVGEMRIEE